MKQNRRAGRKRNDLDEVTMKGNLEINETSDVRINNKANRMITREMFLSA
jgi:hypothetical protein